MVAAGISHVENPRLGSIDRTLARLVPVER
jgi:hypothetical protein